MKMIMEYKGFKAQIKEAERLTGEEVHGLPPGSALPIHFVDEFKEHPDNWVTGPGAFVVPVRPNKGLWFDWTGNDDLNTAVLPTVKGANPITGQQTLGYSLERYETRCPKHDVEFKADRYCEKCGYKWPPQNYVTAPNTLWWDGFRSEDGHVRQFFFTEEEIRDVATHLIGKKNTVPAFGFAFYSPKERRERPKSEAILRGSGEYGNGFGSPIHIYNCASPVFGAAVLGEMSFDSSGGFSENVAQTFTCSNSISQVVADTDDTPFGKKLNIKINGNVGLGNLSTDKALEIYTPKPVKEVSIGAGAKINQQLLVDNYAVDTWKETPDSVMVIYFIFQEEFEKMKSAGMNDLTGCKDGMLNGLLVG